VPGLIGRRVTKLEYRVKSCDLTVVLEKSVAEQPVVAAEAPSVPQGSLLERVEALRPVIEAGGDEAQKIRRVPDETISALVDAGFFRFAIPEELGGENATICETIEVLEAISAIDASVGWNVMLGSEINAMAAGGMDPEIAKEVYIDNPRVIMCGGGGPGTQPSKAVAQGDGSYRVWGQSTFISGCHNAEWCFMAAPVYAKLEDEAPLLDENGVPDFRMWFLNRKEWEIIDTWDVAGLRGSGSNDVKAEGALVPAKFANVTLVSLPAHYSNPAYRVPVPLRLAYNKAAVAIGVARGALDTFSDLAQNKIPLMMSASLANRPIAQYRMGECEAKLRAARAFLMESMQAVHDELEAGLPTPSREGTIMGRLACTYAANASMEVVDVIHNTAGTSGMRMYSPLERKLRDAHGAATHRWVSHPLYQDIGKTFLGIEPDPEFAGEGDPRPA
jgi:alkylation response protein AidB-like acyl-CoA dehydrogenase